MEIKKLNFILKALNETSAKQVTISSKGAYLKIVKQDGKLPQKTMAVKKPAADKSLSNTAKLPEKTKNTETYDVISKEIGFFSRFCPVRKNQFVKKRDVIKKGDCLGVITSMNVNHEVITDKSGKIIEFLVEEEQPVEYGQPLVRLGKMN